MYGFRVEIPYLIFFFLLTIGFFLNEIIILGQSLALDQILYTFCEIVNLTLQIF